MREIESCLKAELSQKTFGHPDLPIERLPTSFFGAYWRAKCTKIQPAQSNNSKTLYAKRLKPSTSTLWE